MAQRGGQGGIIVRGATQKEELNGSQIKKFLDILCVFGGGGGVKRYCDPGES